MTTTCTEGKGLRQVFQGATCTGDTVFTQHDDFCHCKAGPSATPDCADPSNGPNSALGLNVAVILTHPCIFY